MTHTKPGKPIKILLIEDNPGDVRLIQEVLKDAKVNNQLAVANDGVDAMEYLHKKGKYADAPRPDLILLDLNLPRKNGRESLEEIKSDDALKQIPVIILTSSQLEQDIHKSYSLHANAYIVKPVEFPQFLKAIKALEEFWLEIVKLPTVEL